MIPGIVAAPTDQKARRGANPVPIPAGPTVLYAVIAVVLISRDRAGFSAGPLNALTPVSPS